MHAIVDPFFGWGTDQVLLKVWVNILVGVFTIRVLYVFRIV